MVYKPYTLSMFMLLVTLPCVHVVDSPMLNLEVISNTPFCSDSDCGNFFSSFPFSNSTQGMHDLFVAANNLVLEYINGTTDCILVLENKTKLENISSLEAEFECFELEKVPLKEDDAIVYEADDYELEDCVTEEQCLTIELFMTPNAAYENEKIQRQLN